MTSEQKVKKLWPAAKIERGNWGAYAPKFRVTIAPGRYTYGRMKSWAWAAAWDSIIQDEELSRGAAPPERGGGT